MWGDCILNPQNGTCFTVPAWRTESVLPKNFTSLSAWCWAGKSSYRQGSVLAWNQPWTWMSRRMTICQHRQDKTTAMMNVLNVLPLLRFCFYSTLIINSMRYVYLCRCFLSYQCSDMRCAPLFINYVLVKNHYTVWKVFLSSSVLSPKTTNCYLDVIIYI